MAVQARRDPDGPKGAVKRVADEPGVHPEALRTRVRRAETDAGGRAGTTSQDGERTRQLERQVRGLGRADEILRKTSASSGPGGARPPVGVIDSSIHDSRADPRAWPIREPLTGAGVRITPSAFHAARSRPPSARSVHDETLKTGTAKVHEAQHAVNPVRGPRPPRGD